MDHDDGRARPRARSGTPVQDDHGVVFDFSDRRPPDIRDLTLLITARMLVLRNERPVWVCSLPHPTWEVLEAMGLAHLFHFFPAGNGRGN